MKGEEQRSKPNAVGGGGLDAFAKSIGPCQPALSAQAGMGRNFSPSLIFLLVKRLFYIMIQPSAPLLYTRFQKKVCTFFSAIFHLLETLAQSNYCGSVTTERSTDAGDVVASCRHR